MAAATAEVTSVRGKSRYAGGHRPLGVVHQDKLCNETLFQVRRKGKLWPVCTQSTSTSEKAVAASAGRSAGRVLAATALAEDATRGDRRSARGQRQLGRLLPTQRRAGLGLEHGERDRGVAEAAVRVHQIQVQRMADNSIQQALIEDPPNVLKRKPSEGAKRFRRCRSTPSDPTDQKPAENRSVLKAKELFTEIRPSFRLVGLLLFAYLLVGVIIFYLFMDQLSGKTTDRVLDALYFVIVTMTSVGYGDLFPNSDTTKLLACAFVFTGMAIIALFISKAADYLVEKQEVLFFKALHMNMKGSEAKMLRAMETNKIKYKFYTVALLLAMVIAAGTVFLWKVEKLSLVDSFYCVCATITTLGYGDKSFSSKLGRVFAVFWITTSTIIMAQFFLYLAELYTERRQKMLAKWVLTRRITTMDLEAADLDGNRQVVAAEFVLYKLKELGKISQEEISCFLEEFNQLDVDQSGTLSTYDLNLAQTSQ